MHIMLIVIVFCSFWTRYFHSPHFSSILTYHSSSDILPTSFVTARPIFLWAQFYFYWNLPWRYQFSPWTSWPRGIPVEKTLQIPKLGNIFQLTVIKHNPKRFFVLSPPHNFCFFFYIDFNAVFCTCNQNWIQHLLPFFRGFDQQQDVIRVMYNLMTFPANLKYHNSSKDLTINCSPHI